MTTSLPEPYQISSRTGQNLQNCKQAISIFQHLSPSFVLRISIGYFIKLWNVNIIAYCYRTIQASGLVGPIPSGIGTLVKLTDL